MTRHSTVAAFGAGCLATAFGIWLTTAVGAQGSRDSGIRVCAAADGTLSLAQAGGCAGGQSTLQLSTTPRSEGTPGTPPPGPSAKACEARVAELQSRLANLEAAAGKGALASRVTAPFEVVDRSGQKIFVVDRGLAQLHNSAGKVVASMAGTAAGGFFTAVSGTGNLSATVGVSGARGGLVVNEGNALRMEIGKQESGNFSARFLGKAAVVAAIGESIDGTGAATVSDASGIYKGVMQLTSDGKGYIAILNNARTRVAALTEGLNGGGLLTIGDSGGERMVVAGVNAGGFGVVQTGPASFMTNAGLGLPGSYIAGKR